MSRRTPEILVPYLLWTLDGALANYAGVSPDEPIGEPHQRSWELLAGALDRGYDVVVLTWRDPGLVHAWMEKARLNRLALNFRIENTMPHGRPVLWVTGQGIELAGVAALPHRGVKPR